MKDEDTFITKWCSDTDLDKGGEGRVGPGYQRLAGGALHLAGVGHHDSGRVQGVLGVGGQICNRR